MTTIRKCGFKSVRTNSLRKSVLKKGAKLFLSGHVSEITETEERNEENVDPNVDQNFGSRPKTSAIIVGKVLPQTNVRNRPYKVQLKIDENRNLGDTHCECQAGKGQCKHIGALLHAVNEEEPSSCTSTAKVWGVPSGSAQQKYKKGHSMEEMFPCKTFCGPISMNPPPKDMLNNLEKCNIDCSLRTVLNFEYRQESERASYEVVDYLVNKVVQDEKVGIMKNVLAKLTIMQKANSITFHAFQSNVVNNDSLKTVGIKLKKISFVSSLEPAMKDFYSTNISVDDGKIMAISLTTEKQSGSPEWFIERRKRITASKSHRVHTRRTDFSKLAVALLNQRQFSNASTKYGLQMEATARNAFSQKHGYKLALVGLIVCPSYPWLSCSPDGIVVFQTDLCLLEIKCPSTCQNKEIVNWENQKVNVPYLYFHEGLLNLKKTHQYYTQLQISMFVLGMNKTFFVVYSSAQYVELEITRNEEFLAISIPKLEFFYFSSYLPELFKSMAK